jgi:hypothetical protein
MDRLNWQPGEEGKGVVDQDGHVHVWNVEDHELHNDYVKANPSIGSPMAYFEVDPHGRFDLISPNAAEDMHQREAMADLIAEADPHFRNAAEDEAWTF